MFYKEVLLKDIEPKLSSSKAKPALMSLSVLEKQSAGQKAKTLLWMQKSNHSLKLLKNN